MPSPINRWLPLGLLVGCLVVVAICTYVVISSVHIAQTTGTLKVTSSDKQASITITQSAHQAKLIGIGTAHIHLDPGTYLVGVSDKGELATKSVQIHKRAQTSLSLNPDQAVYFPSVLDVQFNNMKSLISTGITTTQVTKLELDFFQYKPDTKVVSIDANSVAPALRNPNTAIGFTTNFNVSIDGVPYTATMSYTDITNIRLQLYSTNQALVFDSYNP